MVIIILVIVGLSLLILGHEAGHFAVAKLFKMKVDEFGFGFPPRIFAKKKGETEYSVNWLPFGGFVKIAGENGEPKENPMPEAEHARLFSSKPARQKAAVLLAGVMANFFLGWFLLSAVFTVGTPQAVVVSGASSGSPAASAGFAEGDVIQGFSSVDSFIAYVDANRGKEIDFHVKRGSAELTLRATPRVAAPSGQGPLGVVLAQAGSPRLPFLSAASHAFTATCSLAWYTVQGLFAVLKNLLLHGSLGSGVVGPVGIFSVAEQAGGVGLVYLLQLLGLISINLAVVNLIPFPALDGGRLLMLGVEKVSDLVGSAFGGKGFRFPRRFEEWANGLGFAALILLMIILTVHDVSNLL